jgi:hypothetical protein
MEDDFSPEEQEAINAMMADDGAPEAVADEPVSEAPEPSEEPVAPEAPAQAEEAPAADAKPPKGYVPHEAMHKERMRRHELEQKLAALEEQFRQAQQPKVEAPQYVDPIEDPEAFRRWAEHSQAQAMEQSRAVQEAQQRAMAEQARIQHAMQLEREFAARTPDYQDAASFLLQSRVAELREMGYNDTQIAGQIRQDTNALFDAASHIGMNPAELLYYRAANVGYKKAAPAPSPVPAQQMQAKANAQRQTRGLGTSGSAQGGGYTAEQLAGMSEAELANVPAEEIAKVFGG